MYEIIGGRILEINEEERIITLKVKHRLQHFYLQRSLMNNLGKYLCISRFIQFVVKEEPRIYRSYKVQNVDHVIRIMEIRYRKNLIYYDIKNIKRGTKRLVNQLGTKMFLDLEMSMHPYKVDKSFKQEIIQVGYVLYNQKNEVIEEYNQMIKPTLHPKITKRTQKFLGIAQEDVDKGIEYKEFYKHFSKVIEEHNPAIIVWGRNDFLALRESYIINKVASLRKKTRYINLLKLHKNYFNLKNDLGLFNALNLYTERESTQIHHALEDAKVTQEIFEGFRKTINQKLKVDTSKYH